MYSAQPYESEPQLFEKLRYIPWGFVFVVMLL